MDATAIGVLIGGAITILVTVLTNCFQLKKEKDQWDRTQKAEKERRDEELKREKEKEYHDIISNCYKYLTLHYSDCVYWNKSGGLPPIDKLPYLNDCIHWVTELSLYPIEKTTKFNETLPLFLNSPTEFYLTQQMLGEVIKILEPKK
jgi:hypothetical protein